MRKLLTSSRQATIAMAQLTTAQKQQALDALAQLINEHQQDWLKANALDLEQNKNRINPALYQRLGLSKEKIAVLVKGIYDIKTLKDPVGDVDLKIELDGDLILERIKVPIGVLGVIFESRPDVLPQIISLALMSGNVLVLKGGSETLNSNRAFMQIITALNQKLTFLPANWVQLIESRSDVQEMLAESDLIDLLIPRGGNALVQFVQKGAKAPVLGHADGICHIFVDEDCNLAKAISIIQDAKVTYPSACNAVETVLVHQKIASRFLPELFKMAENNQVQLFGCDRVREFKSDIAKVTNWSHEYGDLRMSVKIVDDVQSAIAHINEFGSHHTDAILSDNEANKKVFLQMVDSAGVFANCSTRFSDGFRYGFGAELGISTAKTHARGPVGIEGMVIYKYVLNGKYQSVGDYGADKKFTHRRLT